MWFAVAVLCGEYAKLLPSEPSNPTPTSSAHATQADSGNEAAKKIIVDRVTDIVAKNSKSNLMSLPPAHLAATIDLTVRGTHSDFVDLLDLLNKNATVLSTAFPATFEVLVARIKSDFVDGDASSTLKKRHEDFLACAMIDPTFLNSEYTHSVKMQCE